MTTNQPTPEPTRDRKDVAVAARLITSQLRTVEDGDGMTFEDLGTMLARRLDRAGLITRSE